MSNPNHNGQYVRKVVLPSGRSIEVVYYESLPAPPPVHAPLDDLHICPECDRTLVFPVEWEEVSPTHWEVLLRCPNCEWTEVDMHDWDTVLRLEERLERRERALIADLQALSRANVEEDFDRFIAALRADQVWPMDF
jgi:hypothetical protein